MRFPLVIVAAVGLTVAPSCSAPGGDQAAAVETSLPDQDTTLGARMDAFLAPYVATGLWSGAVVVVAGNSVVHRKGYGLASAEHGVPNTPDTRFPVASVTKAFTAIAAARLWREGVIDREDTIDRWLPDFPRGDEITVAHLVGHRSGIPDTDDLPWFTLGQRVPHAMDELVDSLATAGLEFEPGERFSYSNGGYTVLAAVLSAATDSEFGEVLDRWVFRPAGMTRSGDAARAGVVRGLADGYMIGPGGGLVPGPFAHPSNKVGAGSAYTTVTDLVAFHRALRDDTLLPRPLRDSIFTTIESPVGGERLYFGGRGPGHTAAMQIFPDGMVAALGNNYGRLNEEVTDGLAGLLHGDWEDERIGRILRRDLPFTPHAAPAARLDSLAGRYLHAWGFGFTLEREGDRLLYLDPEHRTRSPLIPIADSVFISPWQWAELRMSDDGGFLWTWLDFPAREWAVERVAVDVRGSAEDR